MKTSNQCFCCGLMEVEFHDICEICLWQNDGIQNEQPNYSGGGNRECLNDYKAQWEKSEAFAALQVLLSASYGKNDSKNHSKFVTKEEFLAVAERENMGKESIEVILAFTEERERIEQKPFDFSVAIPVTCREGNSLECSKPVEPKL